MDNLTDSMVDYIKTFLHDQIHEDELDFSIAALFGDGSDRKIYRITYNHGTLVFVTNSTAVKLGEVCENDSFDYICRHLKKAGVLTPEILSYSKEKGWFILEDLGDMTLFNKLKTISDENEIEELYRRSLDVLLTMQIEGIKGFDLNMCYSTKYYDKELMLEYESGYFFREFINAYLKLDLDYEELTDEFNYLAEEGLKNTGQFFLHRDYQARNIMFKDDNVRIIDFQGGRAGPLQYDLAALVIDAFVNLPFDMKDRLFDYYIDNLKKIMEVDAADFKRRLYIIAIQRTMQALGAYAFLTLKKGKTHFEEHMGKGVNNLRVFLDRVDCRDKCPKLNEIVDKVYERFHGEGK
ncbi:aminoglycoside phosphotransferase family protein [Thermodesulfobacteriota bacterium]